MTSEGADIEMYIVDVLRYDIEEIASIQDLLNGTGCVGWRFAWPHDFARDEVKAALGRLSARGFVGVYEHVLERKRLEPLQDNDAWTPEIADQYWYLLTQKGWDAWKEWGPPLEDV
jgi:hypothetical protein